MPIEIPIEVARRFVLGKQGLWPGRRWRGLDGTEQAMRAIEHLQLDPLVIVARAHDLILQSRVIDYRQDDWAVLTYDQRKFFDWGGWLAVRPMDELPYWRVIMRRELDQPNWIEFMAEHAEAIAEMRQVLAERGTVSNRDFTTGSRKRVDYTVLGNTVNVAARLEEHVAGPNEIVVGGETASQAAGHFVFDSLGEVKLKGLTRGLPAFRVRLDARGVPVAAR